MVKRCSRWCNEHVRGESSHQRQLAGHAFPPTANNVSPWQSLKRWPELTGCSSTSDQVTTLGQPLEVVKTQMASQRGDSMGTALRKVYARGGVKGCT